MADQHYESINRAKWDERAPEHATSPGYHRQQFISDSKYISNVVAFDIPLLGDINGLDVVHLQCHIGTDTLSLIRRGAKSAVGLDFSPASLKAARELAESAHGGEHVRFVEASVYDAGVVLEPETFDLVFTGIGALCWLPDIRKWAQTVASLLKPGGRLFIREGHPMLWTLDDEVTDKLVVGSTYFEEVEASVYENPGTYVKRESTTEFKYTKSMEWNHGLGEIVQAVLDAGMAVTGLVEHRSIPWNALHGQMVELENDEWILKEGRERLPLSYTLQAVKH